MNEASFTIIFRGKKMKQKKWLSLIGVLMCGVIFITCFAGCAKKSSPTATFKALSNYIKTNGDNSAISYSKLSDSYFGTITMLTVGAYKKDIMFTFWYKGGSMLVSIYDYKEPYIWVSYHETEGDVFVNLDYSSIKLVDNYDKAKVEVNDIEQKTSSNLYGVAISNATKALKNAISWMTAVVSTTLNDDSLTVHDLYN